MPPQTTNCNESCQNPNTSRKSTTVDDYFIVTQQDSLFVCCSTLTKNIISSLARHNKHTLPSTQQTGLTQGNCFVLPRWFTSLTAVTRAGTKHRSWTNIPSQCRMSINQYTSRLWVAWQDQWTHNWDVDFRSVSPAGNNAVHTFVINQYHLAPAYSWHGNNK